MFREIAGSLAAAFAVVSVATADFLLIPESTNDTVGMYDPVDGTYLGDFSDGGGMLSTPINAQLGPGGYVYVSDQLGDGVFRYNMDGTYYDTFISGYNNVRGFDFRDDHLFLTSGDDYVAEFDVDGVFLGNFIQDGSDPFDIFFLPDGRSLMANIQGTGDDIRLYEADGLSYTALFAINFPEQVQAMPSTGHYLTAAFSANVITEFDLAGTIYNQWDFSGGRGVYELGNGMILATNGSGVWSMDPATGVLTPIREGVSGRFIELLVEGGEPCPADVNGDDVVDVLDLLAVIAAWGNPGGPEDVNGDGIVDVLDLLAVISAWGPCPA